MATKSTEQLELELKELVSERDDLAKMITDKERELKILKNKLYPYDSASGWGGKSKIKAKQVEIFDSKLPIFQINNDLVYRILKIDESFIYIKLDGQDNCDAKKYQRKTGRLFKSRNPNESIDFERALKIWQQMPEVKNDKQ